MVDIDKKIEEKTYFEFDSSFCSSSEDEEDVPYDVLLENSHMISLQCKKYKENTKYPFVKIKNWRNQMKIKKENLDSRRESKSWQ